MQMGFFSSYQKWISPIYNATTYDSCRNSTFDMNLIWFLVSWKSLSHRKWVFGNLSRGRERDADGFIFKPLKIDITRFNHRRKGDAVGFQPIGNENSPKSGLEPFCPVCPLKLKKNGPIMGLTRLKAWPGWNKCPFLSLLFFFLILPDFPPYTIKPGVKRNG